MKLTWLAPVVVLGCSVVSVSAQQRTETPTEEPPHKVYMLRGCLQTGPSPSVFRLTKWA